MIARYTGDHLFAGTFDLPVKKLANFPSDLVTDDQILVPAKEGDAGADLYATEDMTIAPGETKVIPTGLAIAVPDGYEAQVRPRSGNALKLRLTVLNSPGTIDSGYRNEIGVIAHNANMLVTADLVHLIADAIRGNRSPDFIDGMLAEAMETKTVKITRGMRIAQLVIAQFERPRRHFVDELPESERGIAGFGSTGTHSRS